MEELLSSLTTELKRGSLVLSVLSQLHEPEYGYSLLQKLETKGLAIESGTLYPLLRRLEKQDLLKSQWDTTESRPRKFYVISPMGSDVYQKLKDEWQTMSKKISILIGEES